MTIESLILLDINFDGIIFNLSPGTRVLINDKKVSGKLTALAVNKKRNNTNFPFYLFNKFRFSSAVSYLKNLIFNYRYY